MAISSVNPEDDWVDEWVDDEPVPEPPPENPSLLRRAWDTISKPLTDLPSRIANSAADWVDTPELDDSWITSRAKGFGAGALQGIGDSLTSMTSPIDLTATIATGGASLAEKQGARGIAKGLHAIGALASAPVAVHGATETFGSDKTLGERAFGLAEMAGGIAGMKGGYEGFNTKPELPEPIPPTMRERKPYLHEEITPEEIIPEPAPIPKSEPGGIHVDDWIDEEINNILPESTARPETVQSSLPMEEPKQYIPDEARAPLEPPRPKPTAPVDYSPTAEMAARESLVKSGANPDDLMGMSNKQIIDMARLNDSHRTSTKPKIKVRLDPETNTLIPDTDDPITAAVLRSAKDDTPVPQHERINPDTEIDLEDAWKMADSKQPGLGLEVPEGIKATNEAGDLGLARQGFFKTTPEGLPKATGEAGDLTSLRQGEIGRFREPAPDTLVPGGKPGKVHPLTKTQDWLGLPRAIQSAFDLSFPLRQGLGLIHTKGWWKAWPDMVRSFGSEETYRGVMDSIANRPNFKGKLMKNSDGTPRLNKHGQPVIQKSLAQEAGLAITDLGAKREEDIMSSIAEKIPGVRGSNRAYTAFANKLRADAFDDLIARNPAAKTNIALAKELANFVNNASGRGNLGSLESSAVALNNALFSPRLIASRLQMMNPKNYVFGNPATRKEYLKSLLAAGSTWGIMAGLAKAGGAEVSMDMESTDFGKIKIGNTRLDPAGGFQQYVVLASRLAKGMYDGKTGRYSGKAVAPTPGSDLWNFIDNKFSPNFTYATGPLFASKNRPFELGDRTLRMFTPILVQDLSEIMQEDPSMSWILGPAAIGVGANTYSNGKPQTTLIPKKFGWNRKADITFPR